MIYSLQNYTTYSIYSGIGQPSDWAKRAKELGYTSLGISEKTTLGSAIEFQQACEKEGITPILGMEAVVYDTTDKELRKDAKKIGHVLLYCKSGTGYLNLIKINNYMHDPELGRYYTPRVDLEVLNRYSEGLICVTPTVGGVGTKVDSSGLTESAKIQLVSLTQAFGDDLYIGINPVLTSGKYFNSNVTLASLDINPVFVFNSHYLNESMSHLYEIVRRMDNGKVKENFDREVVNGHLPSLEEVQAGIVACFGERLSETEIEDLFYNCTDNLKKISEECTYRIPTGTYHMPEVFLEGESVEADLLKYIGIGFKKKLYPDADFDILESFDQLWEYAGFYPHEHLAKGESPGQLETLDKYIERVKFEFDVIMDMGYLEYFHIIDDLCRHNTERGAARGSAGGSLLSYLLDVTKLDPIRHGLLFERFLNPARKDLPDIDLDFSNRSISDVKQYLRDRYGHDRVFPIVAYSRLKVASAIEAVARSEKYQIPDNKGNLIKYEYNTLRNAIEVQHINQTARGQAELEERLEYPNFKEFYDRHKNWFDTVIMPLQDAIIGIGVHAAGTIITHENYNECLPVQWHSNTSGFVTQWRDKACEARGYPKFDLLVVKALDCVYYAKDLIKRRHGVEIPNYDEIPLDDEAALEIFRNVQTDGIFQFNTFTAKNYLPVLRPDSFKDLVVSTAVCRKGTMLKGIDQEYAKVKNGEAPLTYYHEDLEEIMEETYGFMIYQETMSQVVQIIGGLSKEEAEFVRKACGKKKLDEMKLWEGKFKSGAEEKGYDEDFVNELWEKILDFTEYSFNKSHSVGYAMLAYYQAYIKSRYPVEYWCGVLEYASDDKKKDSSAQNVKYNAIAEGMEFIYPTISNFYANFFPASDTLINWPLNRLKGIGSKAVDEMTTDGRRSFRDIADMMENTSGKALNKRIYNSLISSGFFDPLGRPWEAARVYYAMRKEMVPYELDHENLFQWTLIKNDIYGMTVEPWKLLFPFSDSVCFYPGNTLLRAKEDSEVFVGGLVEDLKIRKTKYGDWYARCKLIDDGEKITVNMWSGYWDNKELDVSGTRPKNGCLIEIRGLKNTWNGYASVNVDNPRAHVRIIEQ